MTDAAPALVHLDDLAVPRFSPDMNQIRDLMATMAAECPLDADVLHAKAVAETGLTDFGSDDYQERLEVLLAALREIDGLQDPGIVNFHAQVLQSLKNRLLLNDLLARHPEIREIELLPPVVIAGCHAQAPRICTTCLRRGPRSAPFRTGRVWSRFRCRPSWVSSRIRARRGWMSRSSS